MLPVTCNVSDHAAINANTTRQCCTNWWHSTFVLYSLSLLTDGKRM